MLEAGGMTLLIHDDATISTALAQLTVDGKTIPNVLKMAHICIDRQLMPSTIRFRGYSDAVDASARLSAVKQLLLRANNSSGNNQAQP